MNGSSSSTSRGSCSSARSSARRWRIPREKPEHGIVAPGRQARALERGVDPALDVRHAVHAAEETQVLCRRELRIEVEVVAEQADARAERARRPEARVLAVADRPDDGTSSVEAMERRVDLPAPLGPSSARISPASQRNDTRVSARRRPK